MPVCHHMKLIRGADLLVSINEYAAQHHIQSGVVLGCVGNLFRWRVRSADEASLFEGCERTDILSLAGTVSEQGSHLHIGLSRENLHVVGGHLVDGCLVHGTADVVIMEIDCPEP